MTSPFIGNKNPGIGGLKEPGEFCNKKFRSFPGDFAWQTKQRNDDHLSAVESCFGDKLKFFKKLWKHFLWRRMGLEQIILSYATEVRPLSYLNHSKVRCFKKEL